MRILFLTHYFFPEVGAPQIRIYELAVRLSKKGHLVTILTNFPHYPDGIIPPRYSHKFFMVEYKENMKIIRTWVYATPNKGFLKRVLNHLSFCVSSFLGLPFIGNLDVIIVESPPLFLGLTGILMSILKNAKMIFNVADLWPDSAIEMGILKNKLIIKIAKYIEKIIYKFSHLITVTAKGQRDRIIEKGFAKKNIEVITGGVDINLFKKISQSFREEWNLDDYFVVMYPGTHGMAHGLENLIKSAEILKNYKKIRFVLVGSGAKKEYCIEMAKNKHLKNILFLPPVNKFLMPKVYSTTDICIVMLRNLKIFEDVIPSKIFEMMACEKPIIFSGKGEAEKIIKSAGAGLCVEPENPEAIAEAVLELYQNIKLRKKLGRSGRDYVMRRFNRDKIVKELERVLFNSIEHCNFAVTNSLDRTG